MACLLRDLCVDELMARKHQAPWECIYRKEEKSDCQPGKRPRSDQKYFEILCLCVLQAGLGWASIRKYWQKYKEGFYGFDIRQLSKAQTKELLKDPCVIKNRKKIEAIIYNAREFEKINREYGSFSNLLKSFKKSEKEDLPKALTKRFRHIGLYTTEYFLHSVGHQK
jgi:DNA-3-methyladenine glycosylase I